MTLKLNKKETKEFLKKMKETENRPATKEEKKLAKDIKKNSKFFKEEPTVTSKTKTINKHFDVPKGFAKDSPEIIGYVMHDNLVEVTNPCCIPIEILESNIKEYKKNPPKKGEVAFFGCILLTFPLKKLKGVIGRKKK